MNSLSLLLIAGEFLGRIQGVLIFLAFLSFCVLFCGYSSKLGKTDHPFYALMNGQHRGWAAGFIFCVVAAILTPSSQLIYMIAASELGEQAVTSKDGQEIINNLKEILKELTKPETSP